MVQGKDYFLITDIGSTTTKAILIRNTDPPKILGIVHANTTVEAPLNDVRYGILESITKLEQQTGQKLLKPLSSQLDFMFQENIGYLSTSSAGGGLQILVIGLTLFDSASSGRRAAYGAGGIILDVFAMDDHRTAAEQMMAMRNLHPDMILLCGGTDGGAISGVLRLAEILRIAHPLPKFATSEKIPAIYAGNKDAQDVIKHMISKDFDLVILPNLRPTLVLENLKPTQEMIQTLFMENVMERAPGYAKLKQQVYTDILPTPMGVLNSLIPITQAQQLNFFAFDVGGATTDVFSYIKGHYQRTVSANLGMSYSAMNVMAESGIDTLKKCLPPDISETDIRNYIGNKTLYPTYTPTATLEFRIEQALAKQAIRMALLQHQEMHYNTEKIGFLDLLKNDPIDAYEAKFNYELMEQQLEFYASEIDVLIGAGGIFAHAQNPRQSLAILIDAFDAHGITEIWLDKDFLSPHLGVLGKVDAAMSQTLLNNECLQKLAIHIRPHFPHKSKKAVMQVDIMEAGLPRTLELLPESCIVLPGGKMQELKITPLGKAVLGLDNKPKYVKTELMVILDTRKDVSSYAPLLETELKLYPSEPVSDNRPYPFTGDFEPQKGEFLREVNLPYKGDILFALGDKVSSDDVVATNRFNPPRLFVVQPYTGLHDINEQLVKNTIKVAVGDKVDYNTNLRHLAESPHHSVLGQDFLSPVRGIVEHIDYITGNIILSEIQDYDTNPVHVNIAEKLGCTPRKALGYIKPSVGDYVYQGDLLAKRISGHSGLEPFFVKAPSTGVVTNIDHKTAIVTIQYVLTPFNYHSHVNGKVVNVEDNASITISYSGIRLEGKLGLGKATHGLFQWLEHSEQLSTRDLTSSIVGLGFAPHHEQMILLSQKQIRALVIPGMHQADLVEFMHKELGIITTGTETLPFSLLIMESFGDRDCNPVLANILASKDQAQCYLETHTRIRAGVARPSICFTIPA